MATKTTNIGQPFGTLTARPATTGVNNSVGQPFLSVTAKKEVSEATTSKFGSLTIDGRKPVSAKSGITKDSVVEKVTEKNTENYPEDISKKYLNTKVISLSPKIR